MAYSKWLGPNLWLRDHMKDIKHEAAQHTTTACEYAVCKMDGTSGKKWLKYFHWTAAETTFNNITGGNAKM